MSELHLDASQARFAIYHAPAPDSLWWQAGSQWLGRCAATGRALPQPVPDGMAPELFHQLTEAPRRYGWHATLQAPFRLAPGVTLAQLADRVAELGQTLADFALTPWEVRRLDDFLALVPAQTDVGLTRLAAACVTRLHDLAEPLPASEVVRRRGRGLDARQEQLLAQWGYPHVLERFRFHCTLTGALRDVPADVVAQLTAAAVQHFAGLPAQQAGALSLFVEPAPGEAFRWLGRYPLLAHAATSRLVYVVGPSGAGKDTLLAWLRAHHPHLCKLARRTITRAVQPGGEANEAVDAEAFDSLSVGGCFAFEWAAHGLRYGLRHEELTAQGAAQWVFINGSREHLAAARACWPGLRVLHITAGDAQLRQRLGQRGRETPAQIDARIARNHVWAQQAGDGVFTVENNGSVQEAAERIVNWLTQG